MLRALVEGTTDPTVLAGLARGGLRKKLPELRRALLGRFRPHHAFLIEQIFAKIDFLDETLDRLMAEIDSRLAPFEPKLVALDTIPGVNRIGAINIVAETGGDMSRFPSAGHLCSWAAMCPGQNESAGKRRSGKTRQGNRYLRTTLVQAALAAKRKNGSALQARYHRVKRQRGHKKAVMSATRFSKSRSTSCGMESPTTSLGPTISRVDTRNGRWVVTSGNSKRSGFM